MNTFNKVLVAIGAPLFGMSHLLAQNSLFASSLARSSTASASLAATSGSLDPSTETLIKNRSEVFANRATADGRRYFYADDNSLRTAKTSEELLQHLTPTAINPGDHVSSIQIVIKLEKPLTIFATRNEEIDIGTAIVHQAGTRKIEAQSDISIAGLTVIPK